MIIKIVQANYSTLHSLLLGIPPPRITQINQLKVF